MSTQILDETRQPAGEVTNAESSASRADKSRSASRDKDAIILEEHIVEVISDSGEGAQRCGQSFGSIAARMGNGIWTVEIIPAEIQPPARSIAGASGIRIRLASRRVTNGGDEADLIVALNEQVLLKRVRENEIKPGCIVLIENKWRHDQDAGIAASYAATLDKLIADGHDVHEIPMEEECLRYVENPSAARTCSSSAC